MAEWEAQERERNEALAGVAGGMPDTEDGPEQAPQYVAYVPLPDQKEIEARVVARKKAELLKKYTSESLQAEQQQSRALLARQ